MQNDKSKETHWTIHSRGDSQSIELRYNEFKGIIQSIKFGLRNKNSTTSLEMTPPEFQKIYLIFQSFYDLLISNDVNNSKSKMFQHTRPKSKIEDKNLSGDFEINTDDWDPW